MLNGDSTASPQQSCFHCSTVVRQASGSGSCSTECPFPCSRTCTGAQVPAPLNATPVLARALLQEWEAAVSSAGAALQRLSQETGIDTSPFHAITSSAGHQGQQDSGVAPDSSPSAGQPGSGGSALLRGVQLPAGLEDRAQARPGLALRQFSSSLPLEQPQPVQYTEDSSSSYGPTGQAEQQQGQAQPQPQAEVEQPVPVSGEAASRCGQLVGLN